MSRLSSEKILLEKKTSDPDTITNLALNHKALSDVTCLVDFKNLERLDLGFNNLSSLQGLKPCVNLKWLSIIENKLQSLKGIEGLTKLTVLNAGKNKLRSMDEVKSLESLRALILNDNEIISICKLDQLQNLNTLVLSRNPVCDIGKSLVKVKSITKLSLSKCQLETIDSSLKFCTELKELRLTHNNIKVLPAELAHNIKVQNLDLGNNLITSWPSLKVLSSLVNLRNLNLQGNPIAERDKLAKKIRKLLPNLQIFNGRPTDQNIKIKKRERLIEVDDFSHITVANELKVREDEERNNSGGGKKPKHHVKSDGKDGHLDNTKDIDVEKKLKPKKQKTNDKLLEREVLTRKEDSTSVEKYSKKLKGALDVIDDGETPFMELFDVDNGENPKYSGQIKAENKAFPDVNSVGRVTTFPVKIEKTKRKGMGPAAFHLLSPAGEVGMGGQSTWDN